MISLGCPKNQVDGEIMLSKLCHSDYDFEIVDDAEDADIVIVNTCGFIEDAKKEAIDNILEMVELKKEGKIKALVVTGCLAERYREEVKKEMPEIDAVVGIGANADIAEICMDAVENKKQDYFPSKMDLPMNGGRILTTPEWWAYLKIADGCSNCCAYCAIPSIRGSYRSRKIEDILEEAKELADSGVREVILVAQDTTRYGEDLYGKLMLPQLLRRLCEIEGIEWIRIYYCYPDYMTDELIDTIASQPKVVKYIDLPLQHADEKILKSMNRRGSREELARLIEKIRTRIPDVILRTTVMVGFPGEGEEEFTQLAEFVKETQFDRLGCFTYSPEEGTAAASFPNQVDEDVKKDRQENIMFLQSGISLKLNKNKIGKTFKVLVEGYDLEIERYYGRSYMDAPEIDGTIFFESKDECHDGSFVNVKIAKASEYDLYGKATEE